MSEESLRNSFKKGLSTLAIMSLLHGNRMYGYELLLFQAGSAVGQTYRLGPENGLQSPSVILLEQLRTMDKKRLGEYVGCLDEVHISEMNYALSVSVGLV